MIILIGFLVLHLRFIKARKGDAGEGSILQQQ